MEVGWGGWGGVVVRLMKFSFFLSFTFSEGPWGGVLLDIGAESERGGVLDLQG